MHSAKAFQNFWRAFSYFDKLKKTRYLHYNRKTRAHYPKIL